MAEIIGPIGFCFGSISFVLSTIPTAAKAQDDFVRCAEQFRGYELRLAKNKSKVDKWNIYWRSKLDFGEHTLIIERTRVDIEVLGRAVKDEIQKHLIDEKEQKLWQRMEKGLRCGRYQKPKADAKTINFCQSVGFILFNKNVIEGWLTRLETITETIETLSESVFTKRTAEHFGKSPSRTQIQDTKDLENFIRDLTLLAQRIHEEKVVATTGLKPKTYGWALGLRSPLISVENWKYMAKVNIEIRFSASQPVSGIRDFHLDIPFHKEDKNTHLTMEQIKRIVSGGISTSDSNTSLVTAKLSTPNPLAQRTRPIGDLLKSAPGLFCDAAWYEDRAELINGISHWALLLWGTSWMEELCCYGLQFEKNIAGEECLAQMFNVGECPAQDDCYHSSRLRNLGVVLAQLILGKPLRPANNEDPNTYQQWIDNRWIPLYRADIIAEVFTKTLSTPLSDAVRFCLTSDSAIAKETFQPGFLFECISKIYKPLNKWYQTEQRTFQTRKDYENLSKNCKWPEEAMYQMQYLQPEHGRPLRNPSNAADPFLLTGLGILQTNFLYWTGIILSIVVAATFLTLYKAFIWHW